MVDLSLNKQLETLQKKADRYDNQKVRYITWSKKIKEFANTLIELANEMDPASSLERTRMTTGVDYKKIVVEIYEKMCQGTQISSNFLQTTYNIDTKQVGYVFKELRDKYGSFITKRYEGRKVFYYAKNETRM